MIIEQRQVHKVSVYQIQRFKSGDRDDVVANCGHVFTPIDTDVRVNTTKRPFCGQCFNHTRQA